MNLEFVYDYPYKMKMLTMELRLINRYCKDLICEHNEHPIKYPLIKLLNGKFDSKCYPIISYSDGKLRIKLFDKKTKEQVNYMILSRKDDKSLWLEGLDIVLKENKEKYKEIRKNGLQ